MTTSEEKIFGLRNACFTSSYLARNHTSFVGVQARTTGAWACIHV
ncbi:hypothetical protein [Raineyella fluvialis]|nr:hypothetical protein [Raineyella fluvialis]